MFIEVYYVPGIRVVEMNKAWSWPQMNSFSWARWHMPTIPASQSLRQEYHTFQASLPHKQKWIFILGKNIESFPHQ